MKNEFNFRSLAMALMKDVSPVRIHKGLKEMRQFFNRESPDDRIDSIKNHVGAVINQGAGMLAGGAALSFLAVLVAQEAGLSGAALQTVAVAGGVVGVPLLNPVLAKLIMKLYETVEQGPAKLFNTIARAAGEKEIELRPFPKFETYPAFTRALAEMKPR